MKVNIVHHINVIARSRPEQRIHSSVTQTIEISLHHAAKSLGTEHSEKRQGGYTFDSYSTRISMAWTSLTSLQPSTGDCQDDQKKVRRSERLGSQVQQTPLKNNGDGYLPSPLTHNESTATEERDVTASPPPGRPSQAPPKSSQGSPLHYTQGGLSSPPPTDTQAFSQFIVPPKTFSHEVEDEEAEGVWGYLVPIDDVFGETLVLKERSVCPAPHPDGDFGKGSSKRGRCESTTNYVMEEKQYENLKQKDGFPSAGYLIGRHPECGKHVPARCSTLRC